MTEAAGWFRTARHGEALIVAAGGRWVLSSLAALDRPLRALAPDGSREVVIDLEEVERLDTAGAWVLHRTLAQFARRGMPASFAGVRPEYEALLSEAARADRPHVLETPQGSPLLRLVERVGAATFIVGRQARNLIGFFGLICITIARTLLNPRRLRFTSMVSHMERAGLDAMPIVGLLSFLIGVVIAFQGADQLRRFGAEVFVVNLVGISVLREMAILITAIIVAGRSGSAFTAEIGTMRVNEEVDAMMTIGLDPVEVLVLPRLFALVLTLPLLTFFADLMGLAGGAVMSVAALDLTLAQFIKQLQAAIPIWSFWVGLIKAPVFAFVIAMIGCSAGLRVARSAESVGRYTTRAVVQSIFVVILLDALFSILFSYLGI
ncbi:MAG TPA: MlaE family lipid ABC transporter permease subunit [Alphaproteobacteria bacterium]|nr:MlaE family lipid ABC transporter permease subunit [Alphaproteobacteria bacterium]